MGDDLQFDRAEYSQPTESVCTVCRTDLQTEYFQARGQLLCGPCVEGHRQAPPGTWFTRGTKAIVFGIAAAIVGTAIYWGIAALTGYEVGLVAIGVGMLVGRAVRAGSGGRGGWRYQTIAAFLTYTSIVMASVPAIINEMRSKSEMAAYEKTEADAATPAKSDAAPAADDAAEAAEAPATPVATAVTSVATEVPADAAAIVIDASATSTAPVDFAGLTGPVGTIVVGFLACILAFAVPFFSGSIIGLVIIAIGVWEAWRVNKFTPIEITGPHRIASPTTESTAPPMPPPMPAAPLRMPSNPLLSSTSDSNPTPGA